MITLNSEPPASIEILTKAVIGTKPHDFTKSQSFFLNIDPCLFYI